MRLILKKIGLFAFFLFNSVFLNAQALKTILNSKKSPEEKIKAINVYGDAFSSTNIDSAIIIAEVTDSLAGYSNDLKIKSDAKLNLAILYIEQPEKSIDCAYKNLEICKQSKDCKMISSAYLLLARVNWFVRNDTKVFQFWNLALDEAKLCKDKETLMEVYRDGDEYYFNTGQYEKNKEIYQLMAALDPEFAKQPEYLAGLGDLYRVLNKLDSADLYYKQSLKIYEDKKDSMALIHVYYNYSLIPRAQEKYDLAIEYCKKGLAFAEKLFVRYSVDIGNRQLVDTYIAKKDFASAKTIQEKVIQYTKLRNIELTLIGDYQLMADINFNLKMYKEALHYLGLSYELFRKFNSGEAKSKLNKVEEEHLKKQKQIEIDHANKEKEAERKIKNISLISLTVAVLLICAVIFSLLKISRAKKTISLQQRKTEQQKHVIEEKQKEIIESITYAKRLQEAILPPQEFINTLIPENFVLYKPKDLVAGDFYWCEQKDDLIFIAAADSTGHGVPGAMVSVVCSNALNRSLKEFHLTETGKILDKTRALVLETFEKSTSEVKDGMDISLLCIDKTNRKVYWSGANNPLWYIQSLPEALEGSELKEIKANKQPIGKTENPLPFTTHSIEYKENTIFYLFTDGYADQFGGEKGKKFKYKQLSDLLLSNCNLPLNQQSTILDQTFENWKGMLEQVDDVCIIGIRV